tara:strand:- start:335 stop:622 length:288 start_codon:yes stop_codon:yes gene_type:complete
MERYNQVMNFEQEISMLHNCINTYKEEVELKKKEISILVSANSAMAEENIALREGIDEKYYMSFKNENELAKYVEDSIDKYISSGHIKSTIPSSH